MRNLKVLGLSIVAMLALSAVAATAALADELTSESNFVTLTGSKDGEFVDQFLTTAGTVNCTTPKYTSKGVITPTTTVIAEASYTGCTTAGIPSVVDMNGCKYRLNIGVLTTGNANIDCPAGKEITITVTPASGTSPCTIHVPGQSIYPGITIYSNLGAGTTREMTVEAEPKGITYSHTSGSGLAKCTAGSAVSGSLRAKAIFTAENSIGTAHIGIFLS